MPQALKRKVTKTKTKNPNEKTKPPKSKLPKPRSKTNKHLSHQTKTTKQWSHQLAKTNLVLPTHCHNWGLITHSEHIGRGSLKHVWSIFIYFLNIYSRMSSEPPVTACVAMSPFVQTKFGLQDAYRGSCVFPNISTFIWWRVQPVKEGVEKEEDDKQWQRGSSYWTNTWTGHLLALSRHLGSWSTLCEGVEFLETCYKSFRRNTVFCKL